MASDDRLKGADLPEPYDVKRAFLRIEDELIASMMRNLGRHLKEEQDEGFDWSQWQVEQLKYLQEYRRRNRKVYGPRFQSINEKIEEAILHAHQNGQKEEELNILDAISKDKRIRPRYQNPSQASVEAAGDAFFRVNDKKLEALVEASHSDLEKAEHAVLRRVDDQYRRIIFDAQMYANTGAGTVEKAVDMATKDFLLKGIDSIQYKNGTRHTISDYADMYIRTAERRAYLMGEGKKRQEWGEQLVIVNRRGTMTAGNYGHACPQCIPWLGKILIDDVYSGGKPDGKHELLSDAMAAGFLHPRCRDGFTTYFPGISPQEDPVTKKEVKEAIEAEKEENRLQYAERQAEKYERLAEYSLDPENRRMYGARAEVWNERVSNNLEVNVDSDIIKTNNTEEEQSRYSPGYDKRAIVAEVVGTNEYDARMKQVGESEKITNIMLFQARKTLWRRNGTPFEDLIYIDPRSGKYLAQRLIDNAGAVGPTEEMKEMVENNLHEIIAIHNHPHNMLPSLKDLSNARGYKYSVVVCHDGTIIKFSVTDSANIDLADRLLDGMQTHFNNNEDLSIELSMISSCGVDMEVIR